MHQEQSRTLLDASASPRCSAAKPRLVAAVLFLAGCAAAAAEPEVWRDPLVFRVNKESAHAEFTE